MSENSGAPSAAGAVQDPVNSHHPSHRQCRRKGTAPGCPFKELPGQQRLLPAGGPRIGPGVALGVLRGPATKAPRVRTRPVAKNGGCKEGGDFGGLLEKSKNDVVAFWGVRRDRPASRATPEALRGHLHRTAPLKK